MKTLKSQAGFTIVELIMVIVILGILSAIAVPKFMDVAKDARMSTVNSLASTLRSASNMAFAHTQVKGYSAENKITFGGVAVDMVNSYPDGSATGIYLMLQDDAIDSKVGDFNVTYAAGVATFKHSKAPTSGDACKVTYTKSAASGSPPVVAADNSGC